MQKRVFQRALRSVPAVVLAGSLLAGCVSGNSDAVSTKQAEDAIRGVKGLVDESRDKKFPIALDKPSSRIKLAKDVYIHLPANDYTEGKQVVPGLAVFGGKDYSTSAIQMTKEEIRLLNVITDEQAPEDFTYKLDMPKYYEARIFEQGVGDRLGKRGDPNVLAVFDTRSEPAKDAKLVYAFPIPWAKDAKGRKIVTSYSSSDGHDIVQSVHHKNGGFRQDLREKGYTYPIVADPWIIDQKWYYSVLKFSHEETYAFYRNVNLAAIGLSWVVPLAIALGLNGWEIEGIYNQGKCLYIRTGWNPGYYGGAC